MAMPHKNINKTSLHIRETLEGVAWPCSSAALRTDGHLRGDRHAPGVSLSMERTKPHRPVAACAPDSCLPGNRGAKIPPGAPRGKLGAGGEVPPRPPQPPMLQLHRSAPTAGLGGDGGDTPGTRCHRRELPEPRGTRGSAAGGVVPVHPAER